MRLKDNWSQRARLRLLFMSTFDSFIDTTGVCQKCPELFQRDIAQLVGVHSLGCVMSARNHYIHIRFAEVCKLCDFAGFFSSYHIAKSGFRDMIIVFNPSVPVKVDL